MESSSHQGARTARRAATRQARDAFPPMGIYAIRDHASGHRLLGASRNVHAALNRARLHTPVSQLVLRLLPLEKTGLLERKPDGQGRRRVTLRASGQRLLREARDTAAQACSP